MMNEMIGTNAGLVWQALDANGAMNTKDLKKAAKIKTDKDLYLALGWLSREDKIAIVEEGKTITVALK